MILGYIKKSTARHNEKALRLMSVLFKYFGGGETRKLSFITHQSNNAKFMSRQMLIGKEMMFANLNNRSAPFITLMITSKSAMVIAARKSKVQGIPIRLKSAKSFNFEVFLT